ncbi:hypothetical protein SYNPS1DRAFT_31094 [Syncephalis pseudoplumigaleata]|uniref:Uncharacterized protein n=1 Tax=Syncephalis pseudoplumigaleata TaxID=1712513 RepID=A0A4P9YT91_9FUNG|nr:hypothetical protein SYNPS1DRAFT_31094 [Syncephalis pseudoplumigaleata]|eukprot:RKP23193.1 hypothetical protein SYNPS1DRAFT_31094 [Syncephalis pseudoplumigaleata]
MLLTHVSALLSLVTLSSMAAANIAGGPMSPVSPQMMAAAKPFGSPQMQMSPAAAADAKRQGGDGIRLSLLPNLPLGSMIGGGRYKLLERFTGGNNIYVSTVPYGLIKAQVICTTRESATSTFQVAKSLLAAPKSSGGLSLTPINQYPIADGICYMVRGPCAPLLQSVRRGDAAGAKAIFSAIQSGMSLPACRENDIVSELDCQAYGAR